MSSTLSRDPVLGTRETPPRLAALFWYYVEPRVCVSRIKRLRRVSPGLSVFGLYGGEPGTIGAFGEAVALLDDNWEYPGAESSSWKWRNGDAMLAAWFDARGKRLAWDSVVVVQWDLFICQPLTRTFAGISRRDVFLPALQKVEDVEAWWSWVRPGTVEGARYEQSIRRFRARGLVGDVAACQFIFAVLPREFLAVLVDNLPDEVGFLEYTLPSYARLFGFELPASPVFDVAWEESPTAAKSPAVLSTGKIAIDPWVVLKQLLNPRGARLFHPVTHPYRYDLISIVYHALRQKVVGYRARVLRPERVPTTRCPEPPPPLSGRKPSTQPKPVQGSAVASAQPIGSGSLISVLMPVYNAVRYVEAAVGSILAQTERDFELIVVDDGSTDGSLAILKRFADRDIRVRLVSRENRGLVVTLNEMLSLARGRFLARMDADDIADPRRFERELHALEVDRSLVAVGCSVHFIDPAARRLMTFAYPVGHDAIVDWTMAIERGNGMSHPALMMRADAVRQVGGYRAEFWPAEDADLVLRLAEIGRVDNLVQPLLSYRLHPESIGQVHSKRQRDAHYRSVAEAALRLGRPAPDERLRVAAHASEGDEVDRQVRWAWWAIGSGNLRSARSLALDALLRAPLRRASWQVMACAIRGH